MSWHFPRGLGIMKTCWSCGYRGPLIYKSQRHFPTQLWRIGRADIYEPIPHTCHKDKNVKDEKEFYLVAVESKDDDAIRTRGIDFKKLTLAEANELATDTAKKHPGEKVYLLKAIRVFETLQVVSRPL